MTEGIVHSIAEQFNLPAQLIREEMRFVLGKGVKIDGELDDAQIDRVYSYFHMVYGGGHYGGSQEGSEDTFANLKVNEWRQFQSIDIDLTSRLTVITGENGTGKTTLLNLLGLALGEPATFLGTPMRDKDGFRFRSAKRPTGEFESIGEITLTSGSRSKLGVREWQSADQADFSPELAPFLDLPGLYLDAQRVIGPYQQLESIPSRFHSASEIADVYKQQLRDFWKPHYTIKPPSLLIKEALVAAAIFGEGNSMVTGDPRALEMWNGFQDVLGRLFPASLAFEGLHVDQGELIIRTQSGQFALEAASGGLSAIVTLAWQIYLHAFDSPKAFTVCFDEPENHLHPSLQRTFLPALLDSFPTVNFVVATHSPFVVTSTRQANIFALRRRKTGYVFSEKIDLENQAFTADKVLDEILGVGVTLPVWAERQLSEILVEFQSSSSPAAVEKLFERLRSSGLQLTMPDVTDAVVAAIEQQDKGSGH